MASSFCRQRRGREAAAPLVEIAEQDFRRRDAAVVHDRREPIGLVLPLAVGRAEMHVEEVQRPVVDDDVGALAAARLARAPRQVVLHVLANREVRQHDVAELMAAQVAHRRHHPAHAERRADFLGVSRIVGPGADHFLQRDDVGVEAGAARRRRAAASCGRPCRGSDGCCR